MTVSNDSEYVGLFLIVLCLPQIVACANYLIGAGFLAMSQADSDILWLMIIPILAMYALAFSVMAFGHWADSGGLTL